MVDENVVPLWGNNEKGVVQLHDMSLPLAIGHLSNCIERAIEDDDVVDVIVITGTTNAKLNYVNGIRSTLMKICEGSGVFNEEKENDGRMRIIGKVDTERFRDLLLKLNEADEYARII